MANGTIGTEVTAQSYIFINVTMHILTHSITRFCSLKYNLVRILHISIMKFLLKKCD